MTGNYQDSESKDTYSDIHSPTSCTNDTLPASTVPASVSPAKSSKTRKAIAVLCILALCLACGASGIACGKRFANSAESLNQTEKLASAEGNITYQKDVTAEQSTAQYWINRCAHPDAILATPEEIKTIDKAILEESNANMHDLAALSLTSFDGLTMRTAALSECETWEEVACNGIMLSAEEAESYFESMRQNIQSASTSSNASYRMAICTERTEIRFLPTNDQLGYSADDTYDEAICDAILLGEPVLVYFLSGDERLAYCATEDYDGWISTDCIGFCQDRSTWLSAWQPTDNQDDFLVVTCGQLLMETLDGTTRANLSLTLGTTLKLVPACDVPSTVNDRVPWNNYVVSVPCRDENGNYIASMALIPQSAQVHAGYLELTQRNIMEIAFGMLGQRYGWGGMDDLLDCSMYAQKIYQCFGLKLPRDADSQCTIPTDNIDLEAMSDDEKKKTLDSLEPGALLCFSTQDHIAMYLGSANGQYYVIGDTGGLYESDAGGEFCNAQGVIVNSLDVFRGNGKTWLSNMGLAIRPWKQG